MVTVPPTLYDAHRNPRYVNMKRMSEILTAAYNFDRSRRAFESAPLRDSKIYSAKNLLDNIRTIKTTIPKKVRETLVRFPEDYGLSDYELGGLEARCRKALD